MSNKSGLSIHRLEKIEKQIINQKLKLLDEYFTFNEISFNFDYLIKLNKFLFEDIYYNDIKTCRNLSREEYSIIEKKIRMIVNHCIENPVPIDSVLDLICEIWDLQPFLVGNTRTMLGFLKVLNCAFLLNLDVDIDKKITSNSRMFDLNEKIVNQKRLTKNN